MGRGNKRKFEGGGGGRGGDGGGGGGERGGGGSSKRPYHSNASDLKATMAGPGILITTSIGRERKAALQLVDVLEEHAERLYPDVKLEAYIPVETKTQIKKKLTEEDEDALFNGGGEAEPEIKKDEEQVKEETAPNDGADLLAGEADDHKPPLDDIQAQIRAELAELDASSKAVRSGGPGHGKGKAGPKGPVKLARFGMAKGLIDCVTFVRVTAPQDPNALVYSLLEEVERTGAARCRFVQRMTPVADTSAANYPSIEALASRVLPRFFTADQPRTYRIEPRIRAHNIVKRDPLIQLVGEQVALQAGSHSVDLKNPELVIVIEILKNICGIGVVEHWSRFKRFNPAMVAEEVSKQREGGVGGTDGASGSGAAASASAVGTDGADGGGGSSGKHHVAGNLGRVAAAKLEQAQQVDALPAAGVAGADGGEAGRAADVKLESTEQ
ncbi:unnamed protein product [Tilletia controversa]|uniref:THUMP domain-containing protein n=2 Tax=Tilletia TaxID=13289 RepID=A0A177U3Q1_9BASI|nr:hypothetical protein CF336_g6807 [Tilletia laevis]KAE8252847.1 hypothetical protein A4X03_0g6058 [Tilletia caries]CAD6900096.1 unnamed protein product [Tilletia controversa]KAE8191565.1 hypothetical protein CF335_g6054 [Tilletia laevis]CAD6889046.1 unnamed protein product [Tilletia caries]